MDYATLDDLEARWRPLTVEERPTAAVLLSDASLQLRREIPDLQTRINTATDTDLADTARRVVAGMVRRAMAVGEDGFGVTSTQEAQGPFSRSFNYANPMGDLYTTKAERRLLGAGGQRAFAMDTAPDVPPVWWDVFS